VGNRVENKNLVQPERITSQLTDQLTGLAEAAKNLEGALYKERNYSKELRDYISRQTLHVQQLGESHQSLRSQLSELQSLEATSTAQIQRLTHELSLAMAELAQYRSAWSHVLKREEAARASLESKKACDDKIAELEAKITELSNLVHSERAQVEHAKKSQAYAEAEIKKLNEKAVSLELIQEKLMKQISSFEDMKKNYELEVATAQAKLREQYELEAIALRQKLMNENTFELARLKDHLQAAEHETAQSELAKRIDVERKQIQLDSDTRLQRESARIQHESQIQVSREMQKLRSEFTQVMSHKEETIAILTRKCSEAELEYSKEKIQHSRSMNDLKSLTQDATQANNAVEIMKRQLDLAKLNESKNALRVERLEKQIAALASEHALQQRILQNSIRADEQTLIETTQVSSGIPLPNVFN